MLARSEPRPASRPSRSAAERPRAASATAQRTAFADQRPAAAQLTQLAAIANSPSHGAAVAQRVLDPNVDHPASRPVLYRALVHAHVEMVDQLLTRYPPGTLFVGIGGSPELLIRSLRTMGIAPPPVLIPITELPPVATLQSEARERDEKKNLFVDRIASYFRRFLDRSAPSAAHIVVLDYVSSGASLKSAADIIYGLYKKPVIAQPIAAKGSGAANFVEPLVADDALIGLLNRDDVKKLTRTVPSVPVSMEALSEENGLMDLARTRHAARWDDPDYGARLLNRQHIVRETSERATLHEARRRFASTPSSSSTLH